MFWTLLLAHFIADYPLQFPWIIRSKRTLRGLSAHVAIHLAVMGLLASPSLAQVWPQLIVIAAVHFGIDVGKNTVMGWRPRWVVRSYLIDQALHILTLWLVCTWIGQRAPATTSLLPVSLATLLSGYLLATYVWFISERIFAHQNEPYVQEITRYATGRMVTRGLLLTLFLGLAGLIFSPASVLVRNILPPHTPGLALAGTLPYFRATFGRRAAITDTLVAFVLACGVTAVWLFGA